MIFIIKVLVIVWKKNENGKKKLKREDNFVWIVSLELLYFYFMFWFL